MGALILNKKTIVVWNELTKSQSAELENVLLDVIREYQKCLHNVGDVKGNLSVPIPTDENGKYLSVVQKNGNILVYTSKVKNGEYSGTPILNGDYLYSQINTIRGAYKHAIQRAVGIFTKNHEAWINIKYSQNTGSFLLSPNPNPEDFVESLKQGNLSDMYRKFLDDVGVALEGAEKVDIREDDYGLDR